MNYKELDAKTTAFSKEFIESMPSYFYKKRNIEDCIEHPENIDGLELDKKILVLGLNPSSGDIDDGEKGDCFVKHIPLANPTEEQQKIIKSLKKKRFVYADYFKRQYDLFEGKYNMLFQNEKFLEKNRHKLSEEEHNLLKEMRAKNGDYLIFSDLLFVKQTSSAEVKEKLNQYAYDRIIAAFDKQLDYYKPSAVLITNATASDAIHNSIFGENTGTCKQYRGSLLIFASMLTGQRAMDKYSYERLKRELREKKII